MSEVSSRAFELHLKVLEQTNTPLARFIEGIDITEAQMCDPKQRVSWDHFARLTDRLEALLGGPAELAAIGVRIMQAPNLKVFTRVAPLVANVRHLYWAGHKWAAKALFSNIETELEILGPTSLRLSVIIPEPYRPCASFFHLHAGIFATGPRALGLPDAIVTPKVQGRRCDYFIEHAPSMTIWSRLRHAFLAFFSQRYIFSELRAQNDEMHRQIAELAAARAAAENALRLKSQFIANVSHEIRTPMNGVIGLTDLMLSGELGPEARRNAEMIRGSADVLMRVINDVLDFSKIEAGDLEIETREVDLYATLQQVADTTRAQAVAKGLAFNLEVDGRVPQWARCDADRLRQVLLNLTSNALKFTEKGSIGLMVDLESATVNSSTLCFRVKDTGIGINESARPRLFKPFVQEDGRMTRKFGGAGLGLAISKQLVELMGGTIRYECTPGEGTELIFSIPCGRAEKRDTPPAPKPVSSPRVEEHPAFMNPVVEPAPSSESVPASKKLLVVEDNAVNRLVLVRQLEKLGYSVDIAENGKVAVEATEHQVYAAILMDLQMPEMDGFQATAIIRTRESSGQKTPIIAVSAHSEEEFVTRALAVGMNAHISKPIQRAKIVEMLEHLLKSAKQGELAVKDPDVPVMQIH